MTLSQKNAIPESLIRDRFECHRCNACCRQPGYVYLSQKEADECSAFLGMDPFDFVNQFCDVVQVTSLVDHPAFDDQHEPPGIPAQNFQGNRRHLLEFRLTGIDVPVDHVGHVLIGKEPDYLRGMH